MVATATTMTKPSAYPAVHIPLLPSAQITSECLGFLLDESYEGADDVYVDYSEEPIARIVFDNKWACKVSLNDKTEAVVVKRSTASTMQDDLSTTSGQPESMETCFAKAKQIELVCDPDPDMVYQQDYQALVALLQQMFGHDQ